MARAPQCVASVGHGGEQNGAVYKITVGRNDLDVKEMGATINARMGLNTWAAFVGTSDDAAVAGGSDNAWEDCLSLLEQHWRTSGLGGILHCFTGTWTHAKRALDLGFMVSFAGNITFPKAQPIRDAAKQVPLDRILIETDSPFLAPVPHRGQRNEPAFVKEVARQLGELRGILTEEAGAQTASNFYNFFKLTESNKSKVLGR